MLKPSRSIMAGTDSSQQHLRHQRQEISRRCSRRLRGAPETSGREKHHTYIKHQRVPKIRPNASRNGAGRARGVSFPNTPTTLRKEAVGHLHYRLPETTSTEDHVHIPRDQLSFPDCNGGHGS